MVLLRPWNVVLALSALLVAGLAMPAPSAGAVTSCPTEAQSRPAACGDPPGCMANLWVNVPGQGPSCPSPNGLWWVRASDGSYFRTHGLDDKGITASDPSGPGIPSGTTPSGFAASAYGGDQNGWRDPPPSPKYPGYYLGGQYAYANTLPPVTCAPVGTYRQVVVYAVAKDVAASGNDRYNMGATYPAIMTNRMAMIKNERSNIQYDNWWLWMNAMVHGQNRTYRFQCDASGQVAIFHAVLPTLNGATTAATIVGDLGTLGFNDPKAKYWVDFDGSPPLIVATAAGLGTLCYDDRPTLTNCNNLGPGYAMSFVYPYEVFMHEGGHTMGNVQKTAPQSSGAGHCNDGLDIMCYNDGGPTACYDNGPAPSTCYDNCLDTDHTTGYFIPWYDCGQDDYYNADPAVTGYLSNHWNLGHPRNRFVEVGRPTACADARDNNGNTLSDSADIGCADARDDSEDFSCPLNGVNNDLELGFSFTGLTCLDPGNPDVCNHQPSFSPTVSDVWHAICNPTSVVALPVR